MDLLALPVTVYFELVEGKHDKVAGMENKKNWPIKQQDIDSLWTYCNKLLRHAYNYCLANTSAVTALLNKANAKIDADNTLLREKVTKVIKPPPQTRKRPLNLDLYKAHVEKFSGTLTTK